MAQVSTAEELLARVAERDTGALGELYDALAPGVLGMLWRILGDRGAAEAALEEAFVELWNQAPAWSRERVSGAAGLMLMARRAAVEELRGGRVLASPPGPQSPPPVSTAWLPRSEEIASLDERRELLKKMIKQLPESQRRLLDLSAFEGYTETELALKLGEPLGRVQTELRAAMRFLRHRVRAVLGTWSTNI